VKEKRKKLCEKKEESEMEWSSDLSSDYESYLDKIEDYTKKRCPNILSHSIIG
jgi:hypothetical protein